MKNEFTFVSADKKTNIHCIHWVPEGPIKAILQISHGMVEYINRYENFALFLNEQGILVAGHDHLGHGQSVQSADELGYFADAQGNECLLSDIHTLRQLTQEKYPDLPYFVLGHSMGSFLIRQYIQEHSGGLAGCIIMGTGAQPAATLSLAKFISKTIATFKGSHHRSKFLNKLALGSYNKKFEPARTPNDWLTKDTHIVDTYNADPLCTFTFTVNSYYNLFLSIERAQNEEFMKKTTSSLPLFLVSGGDDAVGNFGASVADLQKTFLKIGMKDVSMRLYPGDRHEILNETDKDLVYQDLLKWLQSKLSLHLNSSL